jgi:hypothetical protein
MVFTFDLICCCFLCFGDDVVPQQFSLLCNKILHKYSIFLMALFKNIANAHFPEIG